MQSSTDRKRSLFVDLFGEAQIHQCQFAIVIQDEVGCLNISVDEAIFMQFLENPNDLRDNDRHKVLMEFPSHLHELV